MKERLLLLFLVMLLAACAPVPTEPYIRVRDAWALPSDMSDVCAGEAPAGNTTVVFMSLSNGGARDDRLVGARSDVAQRAQLRRVIRRGNSAMSVPLEGGVLIPAGAEVSLRPGESCLWLVGLSVPLTPGDRFSLLLEFERSSRKTVQVNVRTP